MPRTPHSSPARPRIQAALVGGLLLLGTLLLFSPAASFDFVILDDPAYVTDNPQVQSGLSWSGVVWAFTAPSANWHPLTWLSHMLDWQLYGPSPRGHHLTSVLLHAVNAALAFLVFRRLGSGLWLGACAAAVFAWHPLRVESVAWIAERKDVLSGLFFLLSILAYLRYVDRRRDGGRAWTRYLLTILCFSCGLMSKPMVVTLPVLLLVLDGWPLRRLTTRHDVWPLVREKLPFFVLSTAVSIVTLFMQRGEGAFVLDVPLEARAGNAVVSTVRYLGKFFWPFDLVACYAHPGRWPLWAVPGSGALLLGSSWLAWSQRRDRPWITAGWLWYLIGLLPVIGLLQVGLQSMADRYTYLPMLGIELALFWTVAPLVSGPRARILTTVGALLLLAGISARTWSQQHVWRDSVTLFEHAVKVTLGDSLAERYLASALFAANRIDEAAAMAERVCAREPQNDAALATLAGIRERQGRIPEAIELYRASLAIRPEHAILRMQMGLLELSLGRAAVAHREMTAALRARPALRARTLQLGQVARQHRDPASAYFYYTVVLTVMPDDVEALVGLGAVLIGGGDRAGGLAAWRRAFELDPDYPGLREHLQAASAQP
jgi:tetratricopeptide (TPR) repeat protein